MSYPSSYYFFEPKQHNNIVKINEVVEKIPSKLDNITSDLENVNQKTEEINKLVNEIYKSQIGIINDTKPIASYYLKLLIDKEIKRHTNYYEYMCFMCKSGILNNYIKEDIPYCKCLTGYPTKFICKTCRDDFKKNNNCICDKCGYTVINLYKLNEILSIK